jgi:arylsulfatase A-like enzyme
MFKNSSKFWLVFLVFTAVFLSVLIAFLIKEDPRPNIILISIDTLRADHLGCYGYERPTSPMIDRFAKQAVKFNSTYSQSSWTLPSHMSIMTSQYPHIHKIETGRHSLADSKTTIAEVLSKAGYKTQAFISWVYVSKKYGFDHGFDQFVELLPPAHRVDSSTHWSIKAQSVTDNALSWLNKEHTEPFFLFLHYFDPHIDYEPPAPYDTMFDQSYKGNAKGTFEWLHTYISGVHKEPKQIGKRDLQYITALYDGEIRYTDKHIGRLLEGIDNSLGLKNCLVILTSDHGEELNDHGSMEGHQWTLYQEVIHVPLLIRFPSKRHASMAVSSPVELIDIAPTILDYLQIPLPEDFQGKSLMGLMENPEIYTSDRPVFAETKRHTIKQSIIRHPYKLIHTSPLTKGKNGMPVPENFEFYDIQKDPREQNNILTKSPLVATELAVELRSWMTSSPRLPNDQSKPAEVQLSPKEIERLRSVGYVD